VTFLRMLWAMLLRLFGQHPALESPGLPGLAGEGATGATGIAGATETETAAEPPPMPTKPEVRLTAEFSDDFFLQGVQFAHDQSAGKLSLTDFASVWAYESGLHLRARNPPESSGEPPVAVGLFQWTHDGGAPQDLDAWRLETSDVDQLDAAIRYYHPHAPYVSIGHIYQATFRPATIATRGSAPGTPVSIKGAGENYEQNWTLDYDRDGVITVQDLTDTAKAATEHMGARWGEFVARTRWAEQTLNLGPASGAAWVAGAAITGIVVAAAVAWKYA
jgi:hypothetical protein